MKRKFLLYVLLLSFFILISYGCSGGGKETAQKFSTYINFIPRGEYPRPDFERENWINLNGEWRFRFDPFNEGMNNHWYLKLSLFTDKIIVPFPWQSSLSGIGDVPEDYEDYPVTILPRYQKHRIGWYMRTFYTPPWVEEGKRVFLNFGAVDWRADVWINGFYVGKHEGGYTPFSFDITDYLLPTGFRNVVVVRAYDPGNSDDDLIPIGKQGDMWYTPVSGIWQTVYLDERGKVYFENYRVKTDPDSGTIFIKFDIDNEADGGSYLFFIDVYDNSGELYKKLFTIYLDKGENEIPLSFTLGGFQLWEPDNPHLYRFNTKLEDERGVEDSFTGYFGIRKIEIKWAPGHSPQDNSELVDQYKYIYLNGKPLFIRGVLDQGYNPWGLYTYPNVATMESEINYIKSLGFNAIRIHIKGPDPYKLYLADKLGLLVIYDMPSLKMFADGEDPVGRANYLSTAKGLIERDWNHPSILWWVMFNEDWGLLEPQRLKFNSDLQNWVKEVVNTAKSLDPTRPVEDNSAGGLGAYDHLYTDIQSWHFYIRSYDLLMEHLNWISDNTFPGSTEIWVPNYVQDGQPLINSEFGGIDVYGGNRDISWYLHWEINAMRLFPKIQGYVFTELKDVEFEHNGLLKYDGRAKILGYEEFDVDTSQIIGDRFIAIDSPPVIKGYSGEITYVPVYYSNFSSSSGGYSLKYTIVGWNGNGVKILTGSSTGIRFNAKPYETVFIGKVEVLFPDYRFAGALLFNVVDSNGNYVAGNYVNFFTDAPDTCNNQLCAIETSPADFSDASWSRNYEADKNFFWGKGSGYVTYKLPLTYSADKISRIVILLEVSSGGNSLANRETSPETLWSNIKILINGEENSSVKAGEYADARGFLSYLNYPELAGSYGKMIRVTISDPREIERLSANGYITITIRTSDDNGIKIFGKDVGEYPWGIKEVIYFKQ